MSDEARSTPTGGEGDTPCCDECAAREAATAETFVYAIGQIEMRFPTIGIEREYQQRQAHLPPPSGDMPRGVRIRRVLEANPHLTARACYLLTVSGIPAYVLVPGSPLLRDGLLEAVENIGAPDRWCLVIGRRGPIAQADTCAGVLAPIAFCDQLYTYSQDDWIESLATQVRGALGKRTGSVDALRVGAQEIFDRVARSTENVGATDAHRALNYIMLQHPGVFLATAERAGRKELTRIETRLAQGVGGRRVVAVILVFVDLATGVPERLFTRVDVTEEWPFIADTTDGERGPLGLLPFVENELLGVAF